MGSAVGDQTHGGLPCVTLPGHNQAALMQTDEPLFSSREARNAWHSMGKTTAAGTNAQRSLGSLCPCPTGVPFGGDGKEAKWVGHCIRVSVPCKISDKARVTLLSVGSVLLTVMCITSVPLTAAGKLHAGVSMRSRQGSACL